MITIDMFRQMLANIRAIYLPLARQSSKEYPHLSTWLQLSFIHEQGINVWRGGNSFMHHPTKTTTGLGMWPGATIGFDITGLMILLSCPRGLRDSPYKAKYVKIVGSDSITTVAPHKFYYDLFDYSWLEITRRHSGIDIELAKGDQSNWFEDLIRNWSEFGLGFVPIIGPLLSISAGLAWTALQEPDKLATKVTHWMPHLKPSHNELEKMHKQALEMREKVDKDFWKLELEDAVARFVDSEKNSQRNLSYFQHADDVLHCSKAKYDKNVN